MEHDDLICRLGILEDSMKEVKSSSDETKGAVKAGMVFVGVLNALFLPAVFWLFSSSLTAREFNATQEVRLERLENVCYDNKSIAIVDSSSLFGKSSGDKKKDVVKPAVLDKALSFIQED